MIISRYNMKIITKSETIVLLCKNVLYHLAVGKAPESSCGLRSRSRSWRCCLKNTRTLTVSHHTILLFLPVECIRDASRLHSFLTVTQQTASFSRRARQHLEEAHSKALSSARGGQAAQHGPGVRQTAASQEEESKQRSGEEFRRRNGEAQLGHNLCIIILHIYILLCGHL